MPSSLTAVLVSLLLATPPLMYWLYLVVVPARVAMLCPEKCQCDTGGYHVTCKFLSVNPVPLIHLKNVQVLRLSNNEIKLLEKESFVSMTELLLLDVIWCGLITINLGAFNGLTKLTELSMQGNNISELLPGTFENMKRLEYLDLSYNGIEYLDSGLLSGLINLKYMHLSKNKLKYLHPNTFLGLPNVKHLHLEKNGFHQIPTDRNYINSQSLSFLGFSYSDVSALELLDFEDNNLRTVDLNILRALPKLSALLLYNNPLQCDCQLQEVRRWCEIHGIQTGYGSWVPECDTLSKVKGMVWGVLEEEECLDLNTKYFWGYRKTHHSEPDIEEHEYEYGNDYDDFFEQYQVPIYAVPFIFGTTGNVILLIIIICNKDMRTLPNMYISNLAISDIIYLTVFFSEACAKGITHMWLNDEFMCIFLSFCRRMSVGLSAYSVALHSFQRYRVTVSPFQARVSSQPKWRGIVATFFGLWLVAALFAVPSALSKNLCKEFWDVGLITYYQHVVIFELLVSCVLPVCVIAFTYIMTARHLVESSRAISEGTQNSQLNTRRTTAKIVFGLTVVFAITYVPYHAFWSYFIWSQEDIFLNNINDILYNSNHIVRYTYLISTCFLSINSCLNPVALFFTSSPFRQHLKSYLNCFYKTSSPSTDFELARRN